MALAASAQPLLALPASAQLPSAASSDYSLDGAPIPLSLALHVPGEAPLDIAAEGEIAIAADSDKLSFEELRVDISGATAEPVAASAASDACRLAIWIAPNMLTLASAGMSISMP
mgnify:CR=1 FL=1